IAAMSMELYIAVCLPLRHARLCNLRSAYGCLATTLALGAAPALTRLALEILSSASQGSTLLLSTVFSNSIQGGGSAASGPGSSVAANSSLQAATGAPGEDSKNPNRARNTIGIHAVQLTLYLSALYYPYMHGIIDGTVAVQEWRLRYRALVFLFCFVLPRALSPVVHG
ncbi:unnamed protein product, partial [Lampetra planeri]